MPILIGFANNVHILVKINIIVLCKLNKRKNERKRHENKHE